MERHPKRYKMWLDSDEKDVPRTTLQNYKRRFVTNNNCEAAALEGTSEECEVI